MIVTIWWEDARSRAGKAYGPEQLLVECVADDLDRPRDQISGLIRSVPMKGNGNLRRELRETAAIAMGSGPLCGVLDRDKVLKLWDGQRMPPTCISGICGAIRAEAPGNYELLLLFENLETVVAACCHATESPIPKGKPNPEARDRILQRIAFTETSDTRAAIRVAVPTFDRLVKWTVRNVREIA